MIVRALALLLVGICFAAGAKKRDWQTGTMLDSELADAYTGNVSPTIRGRGPDGPGEAVSSRPAGTAMHYSSYGIREVYVIDAGDDVVVASRLNASDKPSSLTRATTVRFAIEKKTVYLLDEKDREFKAKLVKRTPKRR